MFEGFDFLKNRLEPQLQLLLRPWLSFCLSELRIVGNGAAIEIGGFTEQFHLLVILAGHILYSIGILRSFAGNLLVTLPISCDAGEVTSGGNKSF